MLENDVFSELFDSAISDENTQSVVRDEVNEMEMQREESIESRVLTTEQVGFLSDVQVPVVVELGMVKISAAELIDMLPGSELPFEIEESGLVTLKVGDEAIAKARFVKNGDGIGIQIVSVGTISS